MSTPIVPVGVPSLRMATRHSLTWFNWNVMLRGVFDILCGGTTFMFVAFALALGIPGEKMSRFTLAASLGCLFQIVVLLVLKNVVDRKWFMIRLGLIEPVVLIAGVLVVPLVPPAVRLYVLVATVFVAAAFLHMTRPIMDDWVASTIPAGIRGRYLGRRMQLLSLTLIATMLLAAWAGDVAGKDNVWGLAALLGAGGVFGVLSILAFIRVPRPLPAEPRGVRLRELPGVFRQRGFRRYLLGVATYNLPFLLAVPYYQVYYQQSLEMKQKQIAVMLVLYQLAKTLASRRFGKLVDRLGPRRVMLLAAPAYAAFFVFLTSAEPFRIWPAYCAWVLAGLADAGFGVALLTSLYGVVPRGSARPAFFAASNLLTLGIFAVGAMVGEPVLRALGHVRVAVGPMVLDQYHCFFALGAVMMVPCSLGSLLFIGRRRLR